MVEIIIKEDLFKFVCENCGKEFKGRAWNNKKNFAVCTEDDRCKECGGKIKFEFK